MNLVEIDFPIVPEEDGLNRNVSNVTIYQLKWDQGWMINNQSIGIIWPKFASLLHTCL